MIFKANAYEMGFDGKTNKEFVNHHACALGHWYEQGDGKTVFGQSPAYGRLLEPHKKVHNEIGKAMELLKKDTTEKSNKEIIDCFKEAEKASKELFAVLNEIVGN
ncbi:MAG: CZB domain-containing protein [Sulfuricurvum sp.]|nr:CZB domain-containing protein [Sulfuricurvum sp.]